MSMNYMPQHNIGADIIGPVKQIAIDMLNQLRVPQHVGNYYLGAVDQYIGAIQQNLVGYTDQTGSIPGSAVATELERLFRSIPPPPQPQPQGYGNYGYGAPQQQSTYGTFPDQQQGYGSNYNRIRIGGNNNSPMGGMRPQMGGNNSTANFINNANNQQGYGSYGGQVAAYDANTSPIPDSTNIFKATMGGVTNNTNVQNNNPGIVQPGNNTAPQQQHTVTNSNATQAAINQENYEIDQRNKYALQQWVAQFSTQMVDAMATSRAERTRKKLELASQQQKALDELKDDDIQLEVFQVEHEEAKLDAVIGVIECPCVSDMSAVTTMQRSAPNSMNNNRAYMGLITYPKLHAKYFGGVDIKHLRPHIADVFSKLEETLKLLRGGEMSTSDAILDLHELFANGKIDRRINAYFKKQLMDGFTSKVKFYLADGRDPFNMINFTEIEHLDTILHSVDTAINVDPNDAPLPPKFIKLFTKYPQYKAVIRDIVITTLCEIVDPAGSWTPILESDDRSCLYLIKHPNVQLLDEERKLFENTAPGVSEEVILDNLNKYLFHLTTKRVVVTNLSHTDLGIKADHYGTVIIDDNNYALSTLNSLLAMDTKATKCECPLVSMIMLDASSEVVGKCLIGKSLDGKYLIKNESID